TYTASSAIHSLSLHDALPICFTVLLKHLLLQNGDGGGLTATVVSWSGVTPEDTNSRIGRQPRIDIANGCEKVRVRVFGGDPGPRSEEHTSELQSPYDLVCRLL